MSRRNLKQAAQTLLSLADVRIDGERPWDIRVLNPALYQRVLAEGSLALGESYMDGWWECEALDQFFERILRAGLNKKVKSLRQVLWSVLWARILNLQKKSRAFEIGRHHYDIGNDLYRHMLDKRMVYSCGYWDTAQNLDQAQEAKLDMICRKIGLEPGQKILDIGCGWGSFAKFAAENYDADVTGITVSQEQVTLGCNLCDGNAVTIRLQDYRDLDEKFDHIVSVGMFEHVGYKNYRTYMETVHRCLKPEGRFLLHTIGGNTSVRSIDPWISRYIFSNSLLPSPKQITEAAEGLFILRDWHSFGTHYDRTLMAWYDNFANNWKHIKDNYDTRFYRMWTYYLLSCAGSFRANKNQLWQIVFSPTDATGDYKSVR